MGRFASLASFASLTGLFLLLACQSPGPSQPQPERARPAKLAAPAPALAQEETLPVFEAGSAARGEKLVRQHQCNRCHEGTGEPAPKLALDCVRCHEQIATGQFQASPAKLAKWKPHVMPYRDVPSLTSLGSRLRPAWVMQYLLHPRDLRPHLAQTMPRLALTTEEARDVATYLTRDAKPAPATIAVSRDGVQIDHGKQLMTERGCVACHQMSGAGLGAPPSAQPAPRTLGLAPDLRFARSRAEPAVLVSWLMDPKQLKHDAAMPNLGLRLEDARDLAAFLSFGELAPEPSAEPVTRLALLTRRVSFDEVNERVFAVTCRHCHTNPDAADGDGGPGNTGGFGFKPRKIDFSSYQGIQSGGVNAAGERVSLFEKTREGLPRLVAALVARAREDRGVVSDEVRGMPLGLPPLTPEQVQLVESWVDQGRPL